jgi:DNA-binding CsgD family transcriptional regulator
MGAVALEQRARAELIAAGGRPRRPVTTGIEALTPSERRVAEMAASGMTNREIAESLFVTVKAVQWHLGHVYRKLGVTGREQLPTELTTGAT